jgi:hypothetical protein
LACDATRLFFNVKELIPKREQFVASYDEAKAAFIWTAKADIIPSYLKNLCAKISGTAC